MNSTIQSSRVLELAHRQSIEQEQFSAFLRQLHESLKGRWISEHGRREALADYLERRKSQRSAKAGDEPRVVDPLVRRLLESLGYQEGDFTYNEPQPEVSERSVPDYTVRVPEFLGPVPVFLVESKSTHIDLQRARQGGRSGEESPLDQLRRYVLGGAVHGRIGLLCNGWKLEAWELGGDGDTRLIQVDLHALARAASSETAAFPGPQQSALLTLWNRFSRAAFLQARELRDVTSKVPPPPADWVRRIQDPILETGRLDGYEERLVSYYEWVWKGESVDVSTAPDLLVDALRGLIEQFAEDVLHQLDDALARFREYEQARREVERASKLPRLRQKIALREQNFTLGRDDFERELLFPLDDWCRRPRVEEIKERVAGWIQGLADHVKVSNGASVEQMSLGTYSTKRAPQLRNIAETERKRVMTALSKELEEVCRQALDDYAELRQLEESYITSIRTGEAYQTWAQRVSSSVLVGEPESTFRREFARQTAYVYIVRLLLVRICEDKGLFRRKLSDGGLVLWQERAQQYLDYASGRSYEYLTRMAYDCAQNVYVHFYGASELFDWYRMDPKMLLRALLVLNVFNLAAIDTDIIGAVYGRYLEEGKHEQGRYYTPKPLVTLMLDRLGYRGEAVVNRRIADLACGSGSFLVEACRRLLEPFRDRKGNIPKAKLSPALEEVQRSLFGLEINPFACYLAETNLLIQVVDLLRQAKDAGINLAVDRFQIYCVDSLLVDEAILQASEASVILLGRDKATAELLKARVGPFEKGFDFLIGNPPYVRADEDSPPYLAYRRQLERQSWFTTRHLKWDLYVPFVEQYHRLLSDDPEARCCLVTIESISNAPYATKLRELLSRQSLLHDVMFAKDLQLFEDASWQDNVIFCFSKGEPDEGYRARRWSLVRQDSDGSLDLRPLDEPLQRTLLPEEVFSSRTRVELNLENTIPLEEICYVTKGMVLHSSERLRDGAIVLVPPSYDPSRFGEELVEDLGAQGKKIRHRSFKREELVATVADEIHSRRYLDSREVLRGGIGHMQWLEYGENTRCPARVSRPTFPELYNRPKIVFGAFVGIAVDDGEPAGYSAVPHTVRISILWHRLENLENRSLATAREGLASVGRYKQDLSRGFSEWYICAIALSEPIQSWMYANKRSMKDDVYPGDIRAIPVKRISARQQERFERLEQERHRLWRELTDLEDQGFRVGERIEIPVHFLAERFRAEHPEVEHLRLFQFPSSILEVEELIYDRELARIRASGPDLVLKKEVVARVGDAIANKESVARLVARYFADLPGTFADRQSVDALPRTEEGLLALAGYLKEQEEGVRRRQTRIAEIQAEIDRMAWELYRVTSS